MEEQKIDPAMLKPGQGEALIEVYYSTENSYDREMIRENGSKLTNGSEGCGVVLDVGENVSNDLIGKKVAFFGGAWARYALVSADHLIVFNQDFNLQEGAAAFVDPLTSLQLLDFAKKQEATAVVLTDSQNSKSLIKLLQKEGIEPVCSVDNAEQLQKLKEESGVKLAFVKDDEAEVRKTLEQAQTKLIFDCLGGNTAGDIFMKMVPRSTMVVYGNKTGQRIAIETGDFRMNNKKITGLSMSKWLLALPNEERQTLFKIVADDLNNGGKIFGSSLSKTVGMNEWMESREKGDAFEGQVLIKIHQEQKL